MVKMDKDLPKLNEEMDLRYLFEAQAENEKLYGAFLDMSDEESVYFYEIIEKGDDGTLLLDEIDDKTHAELADFFEDCLDRYMNEDEDDDIEDDDFIDEK